MIIIEYLNLKERINAITLKCSESISNLYILFIFVIYNRDVIREEDLYPHPVLNNNKLPSKLSWEIIMSSKFVKTLVQVKLTPLILFILNKVCEIVYRIYKYINII